MIRSLLLIPDYAIAPSYSCTFTYTIAYPGDKYLSRLIGLILDVYLLLPALHYYQVTIYTY